MWFSFDLQATGYQEMEDDALNRKSSGKDISKKTFPLKSDRDLIEVRDFGRSLAAQVGFGGKDQTLIATAISEICRNVLEYAGSGQIVIEEDRKSNPKGVIITISDEGPGIKDIERALQEGYSTGRGLGIGLPGAKRIMDEFDVQSEVGKGTVVTMAKRLEEYDF